MNEREVLLKMLEIDKREHETLRIPLWQEALLTVVMIIGIFGLIIAFTWLTNRQS